MFKKMLLIFLSMILLTSCSSEYEKKLTISVTTWVGYTPLFYAKEKAWLELLNIKLLNVVSLSENMYLYKSGNSDAYVGTQYEYSLLSQKDASLVPVMMFDRSNGGDVVMSNLSLAQLKDTNATIDVYLEMDSINSLLLSDFVQLHKLSAKHLNYMNEDQSYISTLQKEDLKNPTLIITYSPYNSHLMKNGFQEVASTKEGVNLLVVDAMFTSIKCLNEQKKQFVELKKVVDRAVVQLQKNPREFYETIKRYLPETSYEEFLASLDEIIWINENISADLLERLKQTDFPLRSIL
ncbi:MAG: hypothetical protein PHU40_06015 [Sulfurimonas sp.]|nr:hypothetical protein [Sulfurimonas sp.]